MPRQPEPDLTNLTEEERDKIHTFMQRASDSIVTDFLAIFVKRAGGKVDLTMRDILDLDLSKRLVLSVHPDGDGYTLELQDIPNNAPNINGSGI